MSKTKSKAGAETSLVKPRTATVSVAVDPPRAKPRCPRCGGRDVLVSVGLPRNYARHTALHHRIMARRFSCQSCQRQWDRTTRVGIREFAPIALENERELSARDRAVYASAQNTTRKVKK